MARRRPSAAALTAAILLVVGASAGVAVGAPTTSLAAEGAGTGAGAGRGEVAAVGRQKFRHNGYHAVTGKSPNTPAAQEGVCNATVPPYFTKQGGLKDGVIMNYYKQRPWQTRGEWCVGGAQQTGEGGGERTRGRGSGALGGHGWEERWCGGGGGVGEYLQRRRRLGGSSGRPCSHRHMLFVTQAPTTGTRGNAIHFCF